MVSLVQAFSYAGQDSTRLTIGGVLPFDRDEVGKVDSEPAEYMDPKAWGWAKKASA